MADSAPVSTSTAAPAPQAAPAKVDPKAPNAAEPNKTIASAQAEAIRKLKVKIDGKEVEKPESEVIEAYQLRQLSDKKRAEAERTMSEYNKLFEIYKNDPIKFMSATGVDFDKLATSYLSKKAEEAMQDPKDVELRKAKEEAQQYKQWVEEQKAKQEEAAKSQAIEAEKTRINQEIIAAIEANKELGLPIDEDLIIQIAQSMMVQDKAKKPLNAAEVLPHVYKKTQATMSALASKLDGEKLVAWLGQDVANKIRKHDLAQLKAKRAQVAPTSQAPVSNVKPAQAKPQKKYTTWSEFKASKLDTIK